jgi:hypothetical protein
MGFVCVYGMDCRAGCSLTKNEAGSIAWGLGHVSPPSSMIDGINAEEDSVLTHTKLVRQMIDYLFKQLTTESLLMFLIGSLHGLLEQPNCPFCSFTVASSVDEPSIYCRKS